MAARPIPTRSSGPSLAHALVQASPTPLLLLDARCIILAASNSFCETFEVELSEALGSSLYDLGARAWELPVVRSLMSATASGEARVRAYEAELRMPGGRIRTIVLDVCKLAYDDPANTRILMAVRDITELQEQENARRDLAHHNELLSQEVRHRVANSLQIIASVMMLNARRTSSEELRGHLRDARNRVLSVADLQRQLAVGSSDMVDIHAYLTRLCETIGASMIPDPDVLVLRVVAPSVFIEPEVSVSLGLIVTELVINALKHGFPDGAGGEILVVYEQTGASWTLSVTDGGVGISKLKPERIGLGTSIVQALGRQLRASVTTSGLMPGTRVSIAHDASALGATRIGNE